MLVLSGACATRTLGKVGEQIHELDRPGGSNSRIHRVQRDGPISGRAAGVDCSSLCGISWQPASTGSPFVASGRSSGACRGELEDPPLSVLADARSGGDRRSCDRLAQAKRPLILVGGGAVGTRDALTAIAERSEPRFFPPMPARAYSRNPILCPLAASIVQQPSQQALADADVVLMVGSEVAAGRSLPAAPRYRRRHHSH